MLFYYLLYGEMNGWILLVADEEFDQLCFDFGIELDDIVSRKRRITSWRNEKSSLGTYTGK